ncbi:MAG: DUF479 domain-containing protein [Flavisolibacter sp.]|nr:DUF479 domain-containing protein [Flavisolibacter sp.]MBD0295603.1 DUF479 domain-containing protein [Flavisolibacter sp.]MBD0350469.1 DUF479 domain-containing protein [Flavisolibacter sp.]MBD0367975.1 DUF479 domain-containing protein [Flavisolibacter sp.]
MNFLAHAYLSFQHPQVLVGNMISDFVKGSARYHFPPQIQAGITLHRRIDCFTDEHPATKEARTFFRNPYRLYSGPIMDIVYDHFLAGDKSVFKDNELFAFTHTVYATLEQYAFYLPNRFLLMLPYMKKENWLFQYQYKEGIGRSLQGLVRRSSHLSDHTTALQLLQEHYDALQQCYTVFFSDVKIFAQQELAQLV